MGVRGFWGAVGVLFLAVGCGQEIPSGPLGLEPIEPTEAAAPFEDSLDYTDEQMKADDPRTRMRHALDRLGQGDKVPEDATLEELQAMIDEKVDKGIIPREHAQKLLKVLESAEAHNKRLERLDEQLFGDNAY